MSITAANVPHIDIEEKLYGKHKVSQIRLWKFEGGGIKCMDKEKLEMQMYEQRSKVFYMCRNLIMFKAEKIFNEKSKNPETQKQAKAFVKTLWNNMVFSLEVETQHSKRILPLRLLV